ncbi:MAG: thiol oxidoreductase, partial [Pseudomonadales bacterium]|nr:thiol oxidoreductase [Pseudomonadales bacterium]
ISGRVNRVWDSRQKKTVAGRFGLKANKPNNLLLVTAAAFVNDIGITNPLFPNEICTAAQIKCSETPNGNDEEGVELPAHLLELTANFTRNLAVPARRNMNDPAVIKGRKLFYDVGCQLCHAPSFVTGASGKMPHLANQTIWPYSDMLIHDMGEELSSGRTDYDATGAEWRTPPLWGVGLSFEVNGNGNLLHDGRARNIEEAILWHGGEAERIKMSFVELSVEQRQWLISFVSSL